MIPPSTRKFPTRIALDTSCVINLLSPSEEPDPDLLRLVRIATEGRTRLIVTPIVHLEVPAEGDSADTRSLEAQQFIRKRLGMFAEDPISPERRAERDALGERFHGLLWPNAQPGSRTSEHGRMDCLHLASLKLLGGGVFVTLDAKLMRKAENHAQALGCEILLPCDVIRRIPTPSPARRADPGAVVRQARPDDAEAVTLLMAPIRSAYPNFDAWCSRALQEKHAFIGLFDGQVAGISVWSPKDDRVVKLSTFYVGDDFQGRGLGPHLLFHQLRLWVEHRYEKVFVTVSSERLHALEFFLGYGFRIEGAATRRYKAGATEIILSKHLFYDEVKDDDLDDFLGRLSRDVFSLPKSKWVQASDNWFIPPRQREVRGLRDGRGHVEGVGMFEDGKLCSRMSLHDMEEIIYPARLAVSGREAFLIPIRPAWADAMMEVSRSQGTLFPNTDKLRLRTDNAYYCSPRIGAERLTGSPALFYVSTPDKVVAGVARILDCQVALPEVLFLEFGDIGVYGLKNIKEHVPRSGSGQYAGKAMALRFAWWVPFPLPVPLEQLKSRFGISHPQTITPISYEIYTKIMLAGGLDW